MSDDMMGLERSVSRAAFGGSAPARPAPKRFVIPTHRTVPTWWIAGPLLVVVSAFVATFIMTHRGSGSAPVPSSPFKEYSEYLGWPRGFDLPIAVNQAWPSTGSGNQPSQEILATRIGAQYADLAIVSREADRATGTTDSATVRYGAIQCRVAIRVVHELVADIQQMPDATNPVILLRGTEERARRCATFNMGYREWAILFSMRAYPYHVMLGNWLETTRIAALRRDTTYFKNPKVIAEATVATEIAGFAPSTANMLLKLRGLIRGDPAASFDEIERESTAALTALTT